MSIKSKQRGVARRAMYLCMASWMLLGAACASATWVSDAGAGGRDGVDSSLYSPCIGPAYGQGTCDDGQICGSLPAVGFDYCMLRPPCPRGMVVITNVACADPCETADCTVYGFERCAQNPSAASRGDAPGWCAPASDSGTSGAPSRFAF